MAFPGAVLDQRSNDAEFHAAEGHHALSAVAWERDSARREPPAQGPDHGASLRKWVLGAAMPIALRHVNLAYVALVLAAATISGALASEVLGGLVPCELCLTQRLPYYVGIPLLLASLIVPPGRARLVLRLAALAIFLWGAYLGIYHAGVEWKFWAGPTACAGTGSDFGFDALASLNDARFVPCDQVQFRFLGLSLAGWNVMATLLISAFIGFSLGSGGKFTVDRASEAKP